MKDAVNFVRWGIPGWCSGIAFLIFLLADDLILGRTKYRDVILQELSNQNLWQAIIAGILVAGAGIPIGYIIYQIYFYLRWNSPLATHGLFPAAVHGRLSELERLIKDLPDRNKLVQGKDWRKRMLPETYKDDFRKYWHYLDMLIAEAFAQKHAESEIANRYRYLLDIIHSLGASQLGITIGFGLYLITKSKNEQSLDPKVFLLATAIFVMTVTLLSHEQKFHSNPYVFFGTPIKFPAELFVLTLSFLLLISFPASKDFVLVLWFLLAVILVVVWWRKERLWFFLCLLVLSAWPFQWNLFLTNYLEPTIWPILLSTMLFCFLTIALLQNRQNALDKLIVLEQYYVNLVIDDN